MGVAYPSILTAPYFGDDLTVVSLLGIAPPGQVRASAPTIALPEDGVLLSFRSVMSSLSMSMAANLGFVGLTTFQFEGDVSYYMRDFHAVVGVNDRDDYPDSVIAREYYGYSLRTAITAWGVKAKNVTTLKSLIAACSLGEAQAAIQVDVVGLDPSMCTDLIPDFGMVLGDLDTSSLAAIASMERDVERFFMNNVGKVSPVLIGVDLHKAFYDDVYSTAPSVNYALRGIMDEYPLSEIMEGGEHYKDTEETVDWSVVEEVYANCTADPNSKPTSEEARAAKAAIFYGDDSE